MRGKAAHIGREGARLGRESARLVGRASAFGRARVLRPVGRLHPLGFLRGLLGPDVTGARQSLTALAVSSLTATAAGVLLAAVTGTLERLPGLLVLVPAAIGMRGDIFGALGSRLATTIHAGTFRATARSDTIVGQNIIAAAVLTLVTAVGLGVMAKVMAPVFGLSDIIGITDLIVVSVVGAQLASIVVLVVTLGLAASCTRRGWDLDNVSAPLISAVGDVVTLPALFLATYLVGITALTPIIAAASVVGAAAAMFWAWRSGLQQLWQILRESIPVLGAGGLVLIVAGVVIEHRLEDLADKRAVLILVPACLAAAGAIGGILSSRLSTKLHLGVIEPRALPQRGARLDILFAFTLTVPVFVLNGMLASAFGTLFSLSTPGMLRLVAISLIGGMIATALAGVIAYYGTVVATRIGVDPDTYGIPLVNSTVDLAGAAALVLAVGWIGLS
ncbi:magnesium transporter [Candidatus Poriferisodalis sp.]|uniref:magnesium transporter n=1 Tax=Candidatus Poriferisodalis sp. TaxID=3101277 RepID=UPI003B023B63